jgi:hypothetical protein
LKSAEESGRGRRAREDEAREPERVGERKRSDASDGKQRREAHQDYLGW